MRLSNDFFITRRNDPKDEFNISSRLLVKSGMVIKNSNGIYSYLPMGLKVVKNIKKIIEEELKDINAYQVELPVLIEDNYEDDVLDEVYKIKDRSNKDMKLIHTSEELFAYLAHHKVSSYKDLHFTLFQINHSFRDESHTEYGLIRMKQFIEAQGYSFDSDEGGQDVSYDKMFLAFKKIFNKLGLETLIVRNDEKEFSEEFQVIIKEGDNKVVRCTSCNYASPLEDASTRTITTMKEVIPKKRELVKTPGCKSIDEVSEFLDIFPSRILKSLIIKVNGRYKMVLLKGNSELNVKKIQKLYKTLDIEIPTVYELEKIGTTPGYVGPINCTMEIIADNEVKSMNNFVCGANKEDCHYINVNFGRDFKINRFEDIKLFDENSMCPLCKGECEILNSIEVGQISKLNKDDAVKYDLKYTDEINSTDYVRMGSYHIGIDRCISAIVEANHDDNGIIWPIRVAPYKIGIIVTNVNDEEISKYADNLYNKLMNLGIDTLLDDRKESVGVKFNDMDLIGIPIRITVGDCFKEGNVEVKLRSDDKSKEIKTSKIIEYLQNIIDKKC